MLVTAYLHYTKHSYDLKGRFELWPCKIEWDKEKMFIKEVVVSVEDTNIPTQEEINQYLVTGLKKEKENILAETHVKVAKINEQIQNLLCICYIPDENYSQDGNY